MSIFMNSAVLALVLTVGACWTPVAKGSDHVRSRCVTFVFCLMFSLATGSARAQETDVRADVSETLSALANGDAATFVSFFHDDVRGFFVSGSNMIDGISALALQAAYLTGLRTNVVMSELNVRVYGNTAVSGALLQGSVTMPGGAMISGTWRYSDTRVLDEGTWKVIQYHISQLAE